MSQCVAQHNHADVPVSPPPGAILCSGWFTVLAIKTVPWHPNCGCGRCNRGTFHLDRTLMFNACTCVLWMGFKTDASWHCVKAYQVTRPVLDRLTKGSLIF